MSISFNAPNFPKKIFTSFADNVIELVDNPREQFLQYFNYVSASFSDEVLYHYTFILFQIFKISMLRRILILLSLRPISKSTLSYLITVSVQSLLWGTFMIYESAL